MNFRICAKLETKGKKVIKGIKLEGLRVVGDVSDLAVKYYLQGADELIVNDVTSSWFSIDSNLSLLSELLENCFIPITIGGGIRTIKDADSCLRAGAERVSINSATFTSPRIFGEIADKYGSQAIVLHIQAKWTKEGYMCFYSNGRDSSGFSLAKLMNQPFMSFVGEIFLTSVDLDGTRKGVDDVLIHEIMNLTEKPIMYCGGISKTQDIIELLDLGVDAVAIGAALHYHDLFLDEIKRNLSSYGIKVRPSINE
jgi:cyclase